MRKSISILIGFILILSLLAGCQEAEPAPVNVPETAALDAVTASSAQEQSSEAPTQGVTEAAETDMPVTEPTESTVRQAEPGAPETEATTPPVTECDHSKYKSYDEVTTPTCEKAGSKITRCKNCDAVLMTVTTPALGHIYALVEGTKTEKCSRCGATRECQHVFKLKDQKAPTCAAVGSKTEICEKCGYERTTEIPKTNSHTFGGWTTVKAATCAAEGQESRSCSVCGKTETRSIGKTAHSWSGWTHVVPTCTEKGYDKRTCTVCGASDKQNEIPALGHDMKFTKTVEATYDSGGYDLYTCTRCGATEKRNETPKLDKPKYLDINAAMAAGNARIQSLGMILDTSLTEGGSSFFPFERVPVSYLKSQSELNSFATAEVQSCYDRLVNAGQDPTGRAKARCFIRITTTTVLGETYEVYEIFCFYL